MLFVLKRKSGVDGLLLFAYNRFSDSQLSILQRYVKTYQFIQPLKSSCLEEFIIKCDLVGI
jgi:hypothetical protein